MPQTPPAASRVTPESAARLVGVYASRWGLTGRSAPAVDWTFTVAVVAGLLHEGQPAWAVVDSTVNAVTDPEALPGGSAHVEIRDIDATPIPGFDGDPMLEIRVTVAHEMGHPVVAEALAMNAGAMNVPAEEHIVETAAQAIVRSEGTSDARVMARALRALPSTLRARISAAAITRARGASAMDPETIQKMIDALKAGDGESALKMCEEALVKAASGGAAPPSVEPDGDEAEPAAEMAKPGATPPAGGSPMAAKTTPPAPVGAPAPAPAEAPRVAARLAELDGHNTRARKAADATVQITVRARLREVKQGGVKLPTNLEEQLGKMTDLDAFEQRLGDITAGMTLAAPGATRARASLSVVGGHSSTPPPTDNGAPPPATAEQLRSEGADDGFVASYAQLAEADPNAAAGLLNGFRSPDAVAHRARLATKGPTGRAHAGRPS